MISGQCYCGAVKYRGVSASGVTTCYCKQCQRHTSYAVAASHVPLDGFEIDDPKQALSWFQSSEHAKRGFCSKCGSSMFWQMIDGDGNPTRPHLSVMAGTLDDTSELELIDQIFVDGAMGYHQLSDQISTMTEAECKAQYS